MKKKNLTLLFQKKILEISHNERKIFKFQKCDVSRTFHCKITVKSQIFSRKILILEKKNFRFQVSKIRLVKKFHSQFSFHSTEYFREIKWKKSRWRMFTVCIWLLNHLSLSLNKVFAINLNRKMIFHTKCKQKNEWNLPRMFSLFTVLLSDWILMISKVCWISFTPLKKELMNYFVFAVRSAVAKFDEFC